MTKIFISYSRVDEGFARRLATDLARRGADIWIDVDDIPAGTNWSTAIQQGLDACDALILVLSPEAMASKNVEDEWQYVRDEGKPVIPLLWRPVRKVHFQLRRVQYVNFHAQDYDTAFEHLVARLFDGALPEPVPREPAPPNAITADNARQLVSRRELSAHRDSVRAVSFSPDGSLVATCSDDKNVRLWHTAHRRRIRALIGHEKPVNAVAFSPDGALLASASDDRTVRLWDVKQRYCLTALRGHTDRVTVVGWQRHGGLLMSGADDGTLRIWNPRARRLVRHVTMGGPVDALAFSPDGQWLAEIAGGRLRVWDADRQELQLDHELPHEGRCLAFSPNSRQIAVGLADEGVLLLDAATGESLARISYADYNANCVRGVAFSPDGSLLAAGSLDGALRLWKPETLVAGKSTRALRVLREHEGGLTAVAFHPDGTLLATASHDATARLWDVSQ